MKINCIVYIACRMTGRDKTEMVDRANYVCKTLKKYGLTPRSPVIEENVKATPGKLSNTDKPRLRMFWKRDKNIIRYDANVLLIDQAEMKSFGVEREYCLNRGVLWRPTVLVVKPGTAISVAEFEDDYVCYSVEEAAKYIKQMWGTRWRRWKWRIAMLDRTLPKFFLGQLHGWR